MNKKHSSPILIAGGQGYIGSQLKGDFYSCREHVDFKSYESTLEYLSKLKPKTVIHCAPRGIFSMNKDSISISQHFINEMQIYLNMLECCRILQIKKFIGISSIHAFPEDIQSPIEKDLFRGLPHKAIFYHAHAKRFLDLLVQSLREEFGFAYGCIFLTNVYGPGPDYINHPSLIPHLIRRCLDSIRKGTDWILIGNPEAVRDYFFTDDLVKLISEISKSHFNLPQRMIAASGQILSVREIATVIATELGFTKQIVWLQSEKREQKKKSGSNRKLLELLPNIEFTPFEVGLKKTIDWFVNEERKDVPKDSI